MVVTLLQSLGASWRVEPGAALRSTPGCHIVALQAGEMGRESVTRAFECGVPRVKALGVNLSSEWQICRGGDGGLGVGLSES